MSVSLRKCPSDSIKYASTNPFNVAPGQVWRDNDPRENGRCIRVIRLEGGFAVVQRVRFVPNKRGVSMQEGRQTRIRLDRFKATTSGYCRVS
ncbi:MAG: hypothetical protein E6R04_06630 [Spirochaetes bacterium]|nr:MAG: hypothetical protein E6R04_06630 [Spirochaetota bacterium]